MCTSSSTRTTRLRQLGQRVDEQRHERRCASRGPAARARPARTRTARRRRASARSGSRPRSARGSSSPGSSETHATRWSRVAGRARDDSSAVLPLPAGPQTSVTGSRGRARSARRRRGRSTSPKGGDGGVNCVTSGGPVVTRSDFDLPPGMSGQSLRAVEGLSSVVKGNVHQPCPHRIPARCESGRSAGEWGSRPRCCAPGRRATDCSPRSGRPAATGSTAPRRSGEPGACALTSRAASRAGRVRRARARRAPPARTGPRSGRGVARARHRRRAARARRRCSTSPSRTSPPRGLSAAARTCCPPDRRHVARADGRDAPARASARAGTRARAGSRSSAAARASTTRCRDRLRARAAPPRLAGRLPRRRHARRGVRERRRRAGAGGDRDRRRRRARGTPVGDDPLATAALQIGGS